MDKKTYLQKLCPIRTNKQTKQQLQKTHHQINRYKWITINSGSDAHCNQENNIAIYLYDVVGLICVV